MLSCSNRVPRFLASATGTAVLALLAVGLLVVASGPACAQNVQVDVFATHGSDAGGGAPYSNPAGSLTAFDVAFATDTGYAWHPFGLSSFGAEITGCIMLPTTQQVVFGLNSDDGSLFFLDGSLLVDNGGPHGPTTVNGAPVTLVGGQTYPFRIEFYEDFGGPSGVDLLLDGQVAPGRIFVSCAPIPEPGALSLFLPGLAAVGALVRRRRPVA